MAARVQLEPLGLVRPVVGLQAQVGRADDVAVAR